MPQVALLQSNDPVAQVSFRLAKKRSAWPVTANMSCEQADLLAKALPDDEASVLMSVLAAKVQSFETKRHAECDRILKAVPDTIQNWTHVLRAGLGQAQ